MTLLLSQIVISDTKSPQKSAVEKGFPSAIPDGQPQNLKVFHLPEMLR